MSIPLRRHELQPARRAPDDAGASLARLRPLLAIAALTDGAHELEPLLAELSAAIAVALEPRHLVFHVYRPAWDDFVVTVVHGDAPAEVGTETQWSHWRPLLGDAVGTERRHRAGEVVHVPLAHTDGHLLGILCVSWDEEPAEETLDLLTTVAALGARTLEQAQRNVERSRADAAIEHLHAVSAKLMSPTSADAVMSAVADGIASALGFDKVAIVVSDGDSLAPAAFSGFHPQDSALDFHITEQEIAALLEPRFEVEGCYLLTREEALERCTSGSHYRSRRNGRGPWAWNRHWLLAPLYDDRGTMAGFIWADDPSDRLLPSRERLRVLRMFANQAATALELARTFEAEHDANERLQASITASPLATFSLDHDGVIRSWNAAAEKLYGWRAEDLVGKPYPLASVERRLEFEHLLRSVLQGSSFSGLEIVREARCGRRVDVSASAAPVRNADGEVTGAIVLHADITERKQAERQLERRHRELGALHATTLDLI
jgi:PAS domain S-box-containing protein